MKIGSLVLIDYTSWKPGGERVLSFGIIVDVALFRGNGEERTAYSFDVLYSGKIRVFNNMWLTAVQQ